MVVREILFWLDTVVSVFLAGVHQLIKVDRQIRKQPRMEHISRPGAANQ